MARKSMKIMVKCKVCNEELMVAPSRAKKFRCCSIGCTSILLSGEKNTECEFCGKLFHLKNYRKNRASNNFCSVSCHASWKSINQFGVNNPNFRNAQYCADGYKLKYSNTHKREHIHKLVVFELTGLIKIPKGYQIHHRDCSWYNNTPENLVLLSNSHHRWLHKEFGSASLNAFVYGKIDLETLASWCTDPEKAKILLPLNIIQQSVVLKSSELLETPEKEIIDENN